jgi:hypothetical protein
MGEDTTGIQPRVRAFLGTEFAALLARTDVGQAALARVTGYSTHQVNNWCHGRAAMPPWTAVLAILMQDASPQAIQILFKEVQLAGNETLGVPSNAEVDTVRRTIARLTPQ